jgi:23S rRNA maturation-related 3'-5' exoribonuclease YhaM
MLQRVEELCEKADNQTPIMILNEIFLKSKFFNKFINAPSSNRPHYGRQGGLLKQTVNVAEMAEVIGKNYNLDDNEMAILLTSAMLHKIGSVDAYEFDNLVPAETVEGVLMGVKTLTNNRVFTAWKRLSVGQGAAKMDYETFHRISHALATCIDSYINKPMSKEAIVLAEAYRADLTIVESFDFIEEDESLDENFTAYDSLRKRRYFKG